MAELVRSFRIFIASPSDCLAERELVLRLAMQDPTIQHLRRGLNVSVDVFDWEDVLPDLGRPQSLINAAMKRFNPDWFVFICWHRMGTDAGQAMTGLEEEWNLAKEMNKRGGGHPKISIYFNQATPSNFEFDVNQWDALKRFRDVIFSEHQALASDFNGFQRFEETFRAHLTKRLLEFSGDKPESEIQSIGGELLAASQGLLNWPRTLGKGERIERPELDQLLSRIVGAESSDSSTILILGGPGTGKSALLATLAHRILDEEIPLLAIKADMLGNEVETFEELREWLHFKVDPRDAIRILSEKGKVVVIIDQLDALSELLDQQSGRLNLLLNLIHYLSPIPGVHIVASSREFEFRHDVRLNSINAERIDLKLPEWDQISSILSQEGHNPGVMGEPLRELLRTPWHLKLFLDIAAVGQEFESLQSLLGRLWEKRVVGPGGPQDRLALLEQIASRMADEEVLWLPEAVADNYPEARRALEEAEIFVRGPNDQTIGLRHQTYYDYTLARAFARGSVSLADHVLQRQDGLFVRPTLLSSLYYLRATSRHEYHKQLQRIIESNPRPHIRGLLIEFIGEQKYPDDAEAEILLPLLASDKEGPRVLGAVTGSLGWFNRLCHHPSLGQWLREKPEKATFCLPFLSAAAAFSSKEVLGLLEGFWVNDSAFDYLTLEVLLQLKGWDSSSVEMASKIVRRHASSWAPLLAERIAETKPEFAPHIIRADLDRQVEQVLKKVGEARFEKNPNPVEEQKTAHALSCATLKRLIEDEREWFNIDQLAEASPKAFLDWIWPWFIDVVSQIAEEEHPIVIGYRDDQASYRDFDDRELPIPPIIKALLTAVKKLANSDLQVFLSFVQDNIGSDLLIVHRFLVRGMELIAEQKPNQVLEYLTSDPRRLMVGGLGDKHEETKRLIKAICPYLSKSGRELLEKAVLAFEIYKPNSLERSAQERLDRLKWTRQHRLRLLRAFRKDCLSPKTALLIMEEERAFPRTSDYDSRVFGGEVGPRLTMDQMSHSTDDELLRLFNELPDETEWTNPNRRFSEGHSFAGGAIQLAREFQKLAASVPKRGARLIKRLDPRHHETYAGAGLEGLAEAGYPSADLITLIESLTENGFTSPGFQDRSASALEKCAHRYKGLNDQIISLLENWLSTNPYPETSSSKKPQDSSEPNSEPILFGQGGIFTLPHGRGTILRAIAAGYLLREPPDINSWARVIQSRLNQEKHPAVWVVTLQKMPILFNGDRELAIELYDKVIRACPAILRDNIALYFILHAIRFAQPEGKAQEWLALLLAEGSMFCLQAYGELLFLWHYYHRDTWSTERIHSLLAGTTDKAILRGLAYAASSLWVQRACRSMATEILCALSSNEDDSIQQAVSTVFRLNRERFSLDTETRQVIQAACHNPSLLLKSASDLVNGLVPFTSLEPGLVLQVCQDVLKVGSPEIHRRGLSLAFMAETLTDIALTLHRQTNFREAGLRLFEDLLSLNIREARSALEILDRKPVIKIAQTRRRKRMRSPSES